MTPFGVFLREAREAQGLGLREAARLVGISATHVARLETGEDRKPSIETLVRISDALDLDLGKLAELAAEPHIQARAARKRVTGS
jgi:transcriptional regulator with XRE-family HTH domain